MFPFRKIPGVNSQVVFIGLAGSLIPRFRLNFLPITSLDPECAHNLINRTRVRPSGMSMIHFIFAFGFGLTISATCNIFAMLVCQTSSSGYVQRIKQPLNLFVCCNLHMHYNRHTVRRQQHWCAISSGGFLGPLDGLLHGRTELSACCNESP